MNSEHIVIVTGLSGSGKTAVIKAMEDLGFFCVDNLPLPLLDKILFLAETHQEISRICIGIDVREGPLLKSFRTEVGKIRNLGHKLEILYLEAGQEALERRYSETRRRHPLQEVAGSVREGIERERELLGEIRTMADWVIDTTDLNVHDVRTLIHRAYDRSESSRMAVEVISFGFRDGVPRDASYVFDCRFLKNPHFETKLRPLTGVDPAIVEFMENTREWHDFIHRVSDMLLFTLPLHEKEPRPLVTIAFGCTGGRHRSVAAAEKIAMLLAESGFRVKVSHRNQETARDIERGVAEKD